MCSLSGQSPLFSSEKHKECIITPSVSPGEVSLVRRDKDRRHRQAHLFMDLCAVTLKTDGDAG